MQPGKAWGLAGSAMALLFYCLQKVIAAEKKYPVISRGHLC
jgi:hypothetical protein